MAFARTLSSPEGLKMARPAGVNRRIIQALWRLMSAALLLRAGGMVNQMIATARFGTGAAMDAYFVASALPFLLIHLFSGALEAAVIPVYSRLRMHHGREMASRLLSTLINLLLLTVVAVVLLLWIGRHYLIVAFAPGLAAESLSQAEVMVPWFYLALPISLVIALLECVLNAEGQFGWPAYAGLLVPLTTGIITLMWGGRWGVSALCLGFLAGTLLQLGVVVLRVRQAHLSYQPFVDIHSPELRFIAQLAWPMLIGALIVQGGPLVDQIFASLLPAGSISALNYALKIVSVLTGVLFVSAGRSILPHLVRQAVAGEHGYREFKETLRLYMWIIGGCTMLLSLLLLVLREPLVAVLFQRGAFSSADVRSTATVLAGFVPGLTPMALNFLLSRAFNALGAARVPLFMALVSVVANAFFDALFAHFWQGLGITLATSAVSLCISASLLFLLRRRLGALQIWHVPVEVRALGISAGFAARKAFVRVREYLYASHVTLSRLRSIVLYTAVTLGTLVFGAVATAYNALVALRASCGLLLVCCALRYPFGLLLCWAVLNICPGSSLVFLNGNNLDTLLILPIIGFLPWLPWKEIIRRLPGSLWLALYLGWVLLGIQLSPLDTQAFLTLWLTMLACVGAGILAMTLLTTYRRLTMLINVLLATASLTALYGLYGCVSYQQGELDPGTSLLRITSLFTQATTFAFYLSALLPLALYRCWYTRGTPRWLSIACAFCLLIALLLTFTRSAYLGLLPGLMLMIACLPVRRARWLSMAALVLLCAGMFIPGWNGEPPFFARFFKGDMLTLNGRIYLWQALLNNFQVTRWLGSGLQSSDRLLANLRVGVAGRGVIGTAPHSLILGTLYDQGVIGLALLCAAFFSLGYSLLRGLRRSSGERRLLYAAALASVISIFIQSLGSRDLWIQAAGASFWLVIALPHARCWPENAAFAGGTRPGGARLRTQSTSILDIFSRNQMKNAWKEKCE